LQENKINHCHNSKYKKLKVEKTVKKTWKFSRWKVWFKLSLVITELYYNL